MSKQSKYSRRKTAEASDIGRIPAVVHPERRAACRDDLFRFLTTYFPQSTGLSPFSEDHRRVISRIEQCVRGGGYFVNAVYRGFAKTTISQNATVWAGVYGHRQYVPIFGSDAEAASTNIDSIKLELSENPLLAEDFPAVCHPIIALENKPQRCMSQTYTRDCPDCGGGANEGGGDPDCPRCGGTAEVHDLTHIGWTADRIVLPNIAGSPSAGVIMASRGLTAGSRGMVHKRPDGTQQRPDFVLIDDPQTDESASTAHQVGKRLDVIRKSILKLGGHSRKIAVVMNATVIRQEDLVEQLLDPRRHPAWQGERIKMVKRWADCHDSLWLKDYATIRNGYAADDLDGQRKSHAAANAFYLANREQMDRGCIVSWAHCYDPDAERSAIQHAYNALIDDGMDVFSSEYQNEPMAERSEAGKLKPIEVARKLNGLSRAAVPLGAQKVTAYIDVQEGILYWMVVAWQQDFTGAIIDYGSWPDQGRSYFTLADATNTLKKAYPGTDQTGAWHAGLTDLTAKLAAREFRREDAAAMKLDRILVDSAYGRSTPTVKAFCRRSPHAAILMPAQGKGIGPTSKPMDQYVRKPGEHIGDHWMLPSLAGKSAATGGRYVVIDANHWKTCVHDGLSAPVGNAGGITIWGNRPEEHRLLSEQLTAEYFVDAEGPWGKVRVWKQFANHPDNHWLDCLSGAAVAASMSGCKARTPGTPVAKRSMPPAPRRKVTYYT
jgi:hypothetical protein